MVRFFRNITAVCVAASFIVAALYCCSFSSILWAKKHACCDTQSGHGEKSTTNCPHCNSSFNAELRSNDAVLSHAAPPMLSFTIQQGASYIPVVLGKSLFINGPPGPVHIVPLYIKFPSLRI